MPFSIQTNVNALIAQENLRVNSNFQNQTIQRLTSGYRINSSGDDAAGLAIANKFRSDTAELTQGVRNANDGVAQLQIMDGGMNNIGKMLDRLKTLATQSASSTFTGDRGVLNSEYQTLIGEIDRQAQSIGLSTGGHFASKMGVYIGGGSTTSGSADTTNGTVSLNLSGSVVDTKALGLRTSDFEVAGVSGSDISAGSITSVSQIIAANGTTATFNISGPGFTGTALTVNLTGMSTPQSVADALNNAIGAASNADTNFQKAGITASVKTNDDGTQQLVFASNGSAFQVSAASTAASALLGNFKTGASTPGTGADVTSTVEGATTVTGSVNAETVKLRFIIDGVVSDATDVTLNGGDNAAATAGRVTAGAGFPPGVTATYGSDNKITFTGPAGKSVQVLVSGDKADYLGLGSWQGGFGATTFTSGTAAMASAAGTNTATLELSINGGDKIAIQLTDTTSTAQIVSDVNNAVSNNATLKAAGIVMDYNVTSAGDFTLKSTSSVNFRFNVANNTDAAFDMQLSGAADGPNGAASVGVMSAVTASNTRAATSGAAETGLGPNNDVFSFSKLVNKNDSQTLSFSAMDSTGTLQATSITLTTANGGSLTDAVNAINNQLQSDPTLKNIVAVKELNHDGTAEGIRFISSLSSFSVKVGGAINFTNANPVGMYDGTAGATSKQGITVTSSDSGSMDISTVAGAKQAVVALGEAVEKLGSAQAVVGKGQNQLNYAIGLAQSQISNFSAAESRIRDADVAAEAANLTKAQVLQQASMAAMAQANSAPQAVLSLLRG